MLDKVLSRVSEVVGIFVMPLCIASLIAMMHYHVTSSELLPITMENIHKRPSIHCSLLGMIIAVTAMCWYLFHAVWLYSHEGTMRSWECYSNGLLVAIFLTAYRLALYCSLILRVEESYKDKKYRASRCGLVLFMSALVALSGANLSSVLIIDGHVEDGICRYTVINQVLGIFTDVLMGLASTYFFIKPLLKLPKFVSFQKVVKQLILRQAILNGALVLFSVCPWVVGIVQDASLDERIITPYVMASLHMNVSTFCLVAMYPASMTAGNRIIACCCGCIAGSDMEEIDNLRQAVTGNVKQNDKDKKNNDNNLEMSSVPDPASTAKMMSE